MKIIIIFAIAAAITITIIALRSKRKAKPTAGGQGGAAEPTNDDPTAIKNN